MPWTSRKTNKWVLEKIKPETLLETKMTKLQHHEKAGFFGKKAIMLGKYEAAGKEQDQI